MSNKLLSTIVCASLATGCGAAAGDLALGKVVVYRNGVAYFERFANVEDGEVSLLIADSKVNDLLKSLKVEDAVTGELIPVGFPKRSGEGGLVQMVVTVPGTRSRRVKLSYVSESPAWKPSYRLSVMKSGDLQLQGWAIVDNVSGEDWKKVKIGVGSTSALSFRYDLWTVRDVHRQTLGQKERLAKAPPTATGLLPADKPDPAGGTEQRTIVLDSQYTQNMPIPGRTFESVLATAAGQSDSLGVSFSGSTSLENQYVIDGINTTGLSYSAKGRTRAEIEEERKRKELYLQRQQIVQAEAAKMQRRNAELANRLGGSDEEFVIEGISSPSSQDGQALALSMANQLRNELINRGVSPLRLSVSTRVGALGEPTTIEVRPLVSRHGQGDDQEQEEAGGESKFISRTPVSIPNQGSSMVSIVDQKTSGRIVYLYDALSKHGNSEFAFKAIKFSNPTGQHLSGGPMTVFGDGTFIGEGLADSIAPGASTILPYALDKQVHIDKNTTFADTVVAIERVIDDGAIVKTHRVSTTRFDVHNRSQAAATVYIRHDSNQGWKLKKGPANIQQIGPLSVFPVELAAGARTSVELVEFTPITSTIDLTSDSGVAALNAYLSTRGDDSAFSKAGASLVARHRSIVEKLRKIDIAAGQLAMFRNRLDELQQQLITLELVSSNSKLVRTLRERMSEMSNHVQSTILEVVELREEIMLERFAYRDLLGTMRGLIGS